jgi:hypothetical protein
MLVPQWLVERRIDFDGVEKFGEVGGLVKVGELARGIYDAGPVGVGPARRADTDRANTFFSTSA